MQMYSETDVDTSSLEGKRIAILGYGSQGRAHALNLKDSGHDVVMGLRRGRGSWEKAGADGMTVMEPAEAVKGAAIVAFLTPDLTQADLYAAIVNGRATATLVSGDQAGIAIVTATSGNNPESFVDVVIGSTLQSVSVSANPAVLPIEGGTTNLQATALGDGGEPLANVPLIFNGPR